MIGATLPVHPVLLLETLQEQQHCFPSSVPNGATSSTHGIQHDSRPDPPMKNFGHDQKIPNEDIFV
jgi:hypothetical protein